MPFAPEYTIRPARAEDIGSMAVLLTELFSIEADFRPDEQRQRDGLAMLLDEQSRGAGRILVAEADSETVAMCTGQLVVSTAEGGYSVLVEDMVVRRDHRRQGIGRALLQAMEQWAWKQGATRLQLLADRDNTSALDFYRRIGWGQTHLVSLRLGSDKQ
ncbi:MAG: N-acetyltransferase family protein [Desulfovibrio sp.]|uniref:GNAT family N-acetyltransferase n=1 Tax=Desulfovibrio sp. 7SRBS1 TaxID=3378064 RepID=UPI003B40E334